MAADTEPTTLLFEKEGGRDNEATYREQFFFHIKNALLLSNDGWDINGR